MNTEYSQNCAKRKWVCLCNSRMCGQTSWSLKKKAHKSLQLRGTGAACGVRTGLGAQEPSHLSRRLQPWSALCCGQGATGCAVLGYCWGKAGAFCSFQVTVGPGVRTLVPACLQSPWWGLGLRPVLLNEAGPCGGADASHPAPNTALPTSVPHATFPLLSLLLLYPRVPHVPDPNRKCVT